MARECGWLLEPQILCLLVARVFILPHSFKEVGQPAGKRMGSHLEAPANPLCDLKQIAFSKLHFFHLKKKTKTGL